MRKFEAYQWLRSKGEETSFLAHVVLHMHKNPTEKLKGLVKLVQWGYSVKIAQFSIDTLLINGRRAGWEMLEGVKNPRLLENWGY